MWGGRPDRNMAANQRGLPVHWDVDTRHNVKWVADLGTQTFGNPVVSGGKIFIGTNNNNPRDAAVTGDKGVLMCFAAADGRFLWQAVHDKIEPMDAHDWPDIGICSTPCVIGDRIYYVSNRGELVCLDTEGFADGRNDGPMTEEKRRGPADADFIWSLDMVRKLGVLPHHASASAPLVVDDLVFVVTGNGIDVDNEKVPAPNAPSFLAVNRHTGEVAWSDHSPGDRILDGQWSSPCYGVVNGQPQVVFPGGDGWLYAFEPATGKPIWRFNGNSHLTGDRAMSPKDRDYFVGAPVWHDGKVFVAVGQAPDNGDGPGCLWAIDASRSVDVTSSALVWRYAHEKFRRSVSTVAIRDGLLYAVETRGNLHCFEAATGAHLWSHDLNASAWASPVVVDGKVYVANEDGDVLVLAHGREAKLLATNQTRETIYASVTPAEGCLYVVDRSRLYALHETGARPAQATATTAPASQPTQAPAIASAPASAPATRPTAGWPQFRGDPQQTGVAGALPAGPLRLRWKFRAEDAIESTAAIVDGNVYVGSNDGFLYCLDVRDGSRRWRYATEAPIKTAPCVSGSRVFVGNSNGEFYAVDARRGERVWSIKTGSEINSSANVTGNRVLVGSYDGFLYCLETDSGKLAWKFETAGPVHGSPAVAGQHALVAGCDEYLHVVKLADGTAAGSLSLGSYAGASAAVSGSRAFVGTFGNQVLCIDWSVPRTVWTFEPKGDELPFYASAAVSGSLVVVAGRDKFIHGLDAATGDRRWVFQTKGSVDSSPVIAGERLFVGSSDGILYALGVEDGRPTWQYETGSSIVASPAVTDCVVIGDEDGTLYCFEHAAEPK